MPGVAQSVALGAIFYTTVIVVEVVLDLLGPSGEGSSKSFSHLLIDQLIAWPLTIGIALRWAGVSFREACPLKAFPVRLLPALLAVSFGATILLLEVAGWIPVPEALRESLARESRETHGLVLFVSLVVMAPVAEELFFRGQVLRGYLGRYSVTKAVWSSAVLFAVFHLNPWQAVVALPLGVGFARLTLRTGSLVPGMVSHAMVNVSANYLLGPLALVFGYDAERLEAAGHFPPGLIVTGFAVAATGGFVLRRQLGA